MSRIPEKVKLPIPFGKYILLERINVGGMAEIFLARSRGMQGIKRLLAIKKMLPTMAEDEEFITMFIDEARIAAELSHASIVQIFELGKFENDFYIAMEFVHGKDIRFIQELKKREGTPLPVSLAVYIACKLCEALDYAHTKKDPSGRPLGIIHRDVSPQNVIISYEGEVKICDFGISKSVNRSQRTQSGVLKGKYRYMSPEQSRGQPLDGRSDLFTVGTLLYEMVTLQHPFQGQNGFSTLEKVRCAHVDPPSEFNLAVPDELEAIIHRAMSKKVENRYQSSTEFGEALQSFLLKHEMTTSHELAAFVKSSFSREYARDSKRLESYQGPAKIKLVQVPPPIPADPRPAGSPVVSGTPPWRTNAPPTLPGVTGKRANAKTLIFGADILEAPGRLPSRSTAKTVKENGRTRHKLQERLFVPLVILSLFLLGWSVFVTYHWLGDR